MAAEGAFQGGAQALATLGVGELLEAVIEQLPVGVIVAEAPSGRLLLGNRQVEAIWRQPFLAAAAVGDYAAYRGFRSGGRPLRAEEWPLARSIATGEVVRGELVEIERGDGTRATISVDSAPIRDRDGVARAAVAVFNDVTEQQGDRRLLELLAETGALLESPLDVDVQLHHVAQMCVPALGDACSLYLLDDQGRIVRHMAVADPRLERRMTAALADTIDPDADLPVPRVLRTGLPEIAAEVPLDVLRRLARDPAHPEPVLALAPMSALMLPMRARGVTVGAMGAFSVGRVRTFTPSELQTAMEVARRCALAVENHDMYRRQHRVADTLQASLLPSDLPDVPGVELAASYLPASDEVAVGGDFYDVFELDRGWGLVIGDACGKGAGAAAVTGLARSTVRAAAMLDPRPRRVLELLNRALAREAPEHRLVTAVAGWLQPTDGGWRLRLATGGHPPPVRVGPDRVRMLELAGTMLGAVRDPAIGEFELTLPSGEALLLYTDGVTDARGPDGFLGEDRLLARLAGEDCTPAAVVARVEAALLAPDVRRGDDVAMLAIGARA